VRIVVITRQFVMVSSFLRQETAREYIVINNSVCVSLPTIMGPNVTNCATGMRAYTVRTSWRSHIVASPAVKKLEGPPNDITSVITLINYQSQLFTLWSVDPHDVL
jgi:hypothetical protein